MKVSSLNTSVECICSRDLVHLERAELAGAWNSFPFSVDSLHPG